MPPDARIGLTHKFTFYAIHLEDVVNGDRLELRCRYSSVLFRFTVASDLGSVTVILLRRPMLKESILVLKGKW